MGVKIFKIHTKVLYKKKLNFLNTKVLNLFEKNKKLAFVIANLLLILS